MTPPRGGSFIAESTAPSKYTVAVVLPGTEGAQPDQQGGLIVGVLQGHPRHATDQVVTIDKVGHTVSGGISRQRAIVLPEYFPSGLRRFRSVVREKESGQVGLCYHAAHG